MVCLFYRVFYLFYVVFCFFYVGRPGGRPAVTPLGPMSSDTSTLVPRPFYLFYAEFHLFYRWRV